MILRHIQFRLWHALGLLAVIAIFLAVWQHQARRPIVLQVCGNGIVVLDGTGMRCDELTKALQTMERSRRQWCLGTSLTMKIDINAGYNDVSEASAATYASGVEHRLESGSKYVIIDLSGVELPTEHKIVNLPPKD